MLRIVKVVAYPWINHTNEEFTRVEVYKRGEPEGVIVSESIYFDDCVKEEVKL
jgi:hypothetical protein